MVEQSVVFCSFNNEMVNCIENLKKKRDELLCIINLEEIEKAKLTEQIHQLNDRLAMIHHSIRLKNQAKCEYDKAIIESEQELTKLLELSQDLFQSTRREVLVLENMIPQNPPDLCLLNFSKNGEIDSKSAITCCEKRVGPSTKTYRYMPCKANGL